jgi:hypothetical protein
MMGADYPGAETAFPCAASSVDHSRLLSFSDILFGQGADSSDILPEITD